MKKAIVISGFLLLTLIGFTQVPSSKSIEKVKRVSVYGNAEFMVFNKPILKEETFCNGQELPLICRYERFQKSFCNCDYSEDEVDGSMPIIRGCRGTITYIDGLPVRHRSTPAVASFEEIPIFYSGLSAKYEAYSKE